MKIPQNRIKNIPQNENKLWLNQRTIIIFFYKNISIMQNEYDIDKPILLDSPKVSDRPSDIFKVGLTQSNIDLFCKSEIFNDQDYHDEKEKSISINVQDEQVLYDTLFSPCTMADSLMRRNQSLEMQYLQNSVSSSEHDSIYNRRKKRVRKMEEKKKNEKHILEDLKNSDLEKYKVVMSFLHLFYRIKSAVNGIRIDYYSSKTFTALKNSDTQSLRKLTKVLLDMAENLYNLPGKDNDANHWKAEFMIIPRFLISKQKIKRLVNDQKLQRNISLLIYYGCFGHYNNEGNKKFPEEKQMDLFRAMIRQKKGKQKFKKISSINHGSQFLRYHEAEYYELYGRSLKYLSFLEQELKKKKKYEVIKKQLEIYAEDKDSDEQQIEKSEREFGKVEDIKSIGQYLQRRESKCDDSQKNPSLQLTHQESRQTEIKKNSKLKKLNSLQPVEITPIAEKFKLKARKAFTFRDDNYSPVILISPPKPQHPIEESEQF